MKIAVASKEEMVSEHFGHCENFNFFEIVGGEVKSQEMVKSPGHDCHALPSFLKENGIEVLISGGIGKGAMDNCLNQGLEVVTGARGKALDVAVEYEKGNLTSTNELCAHKH